LSKSKGDVKPAPKRAAVRKSGKRAAMDADWFSLYITVVILKERAIIVRLPQIWGKCSPRLTAIKESIKNNEV
jgi:hypothetical protein